MLGLPRRLVDVACRAAELNCADLTSDQKPVRVTGSDPYGLDADGNGLGCTS